MSTLRALVRLRKSAGLDGTIETLKTALSKATDKAAREFLLTRLTDLERAAKQGLVTEETLKRIEAAVQEEFAAPLAELAKRPFVEALTHAWADGKQAVQADFGLKTPDYNAIKILRDYNTGRVSEFMNEQAGSVLKALTTQALQEGWKTDTLAEKLSEGMKAFSERSRTYWNNVSDHWVHKAHNLGHVSGYEEAQIERVKIVAILDGHTSTVCRRMHGRIIETKHLSAQRDRILAAAKSGDLEQIKAAQPMIKEGEEPFGPQASTEDIVKLAIGLPPYHFGCRSNTVAYFERVTLAREYGPQVRKEDREKLDKTFSDDELNEWVKDVKRLAKKGTLPYKAKDLKDDEKHFSELGAATETEYLKQCRDAVTQANRVVFQRFLKESSGKDELQLAFYDGGRIVIVDRDFLIRHGTNGNEKKWNRWIQRRGRSLQ